MLEQTPFRDIWKHVNDADWSTPGFDVKKAHVLALFSELTYYKIPEFEIKSADRVNLVPCIAYQNAVRLHRTFEFDQILRALDLAEFFVVVRRYAIVVGVRLRNMIVIAIRGTKYLYDWMVNMRASHYAYGGRGGSARFHKGFFRAICACFEPISLELRRLMNANAASIPIFVTGHSLGGALAAIMHATWGMTISEEYVHEGGVVGHRRSTSACYTFGMPRYGDLNAVMQYREPYHLYNDADVVPSVPPRWLGYENCFNEFKLDGTTLESIHGRETVKFFTWIFHLVSGTGIKNHNIELYRERIALQA